MTMFKLKTAVATGCLVAIAAISPACWADEKVDPLQTSLGNTTISGYVDASTTFQIQDTPEPGTLTLLAFCGGAFGMFVAKRGKNC